MKKKPNIIIFNPDQFRADALGHLGNAASITPNMDKIALEEGVSFRNAFCQNPVCTPSRCSFMSGWYPHVRGHRTMFHMMHEDEPVLLKELKDRNYCVWWGGKNDLISAKDSLEPYCDIKFKPSRPLRPNLHTETEWRGNEKGDNYYSFYKGKLDTENDEIYYDSDFDCIYGAKEFIEEYKEDKPFCIYLPLNYPHPPYAVEEPWYSMIDRGKIPNRIPTITDWKDKPSLLEGIYNRQNLKEWTEERWTELRATYLGMCSRVDYQLGVLMETLKQKNIYEETAIFIISDHGDFTGDYGLVEKTQNTFEDCLVKVPFIIKLPKEIQASIGIKDTLVELVDLPATIYDLIDIEVEYSHFGKSLLPIIQGNIEQHREVVFCEGGRVKGERQCMELEMIENTVPTGLYWPRVGLQIQEGPEHGKATMCRTKGYKYVRRMYEEDELYDLNKDPGEELNLIAKEEVQHIIRDMKEKMLQFYFETADVVPHKVDSRF